MPAPPPPRTDLAPPPHCAGCGAQAVVCLVGIDRVRFDAALAADAIDTLAALHPWQCSTCGRSDAAAFATLPPRDWCDALHHAVAAHDAARERARAARTRYLARNTRLAREAEEQARERAARAASNASKSAVEAALARARAARGKPTDI